MHAVPHENARLDAEFERITGVVRVTACAHSAHCAPQRWHGSSTASLSEIEGVTVAHEDALLVAQVPHDAHQVADQVVDAVRPPALSHTVRHGLRLACSLDVTTQLAIIPSQYQT